MEGRDELIDMFVVRVREVLPAGVRVRAEHGIITIEGEREGMLVLAPLWSAPCYERVWTLMTRW